MDKSAWISGSWHNTNVHPCAFSPNDHHAAKAARFYVAMYPEGGRVLDVGFGRGAFLDTATAAGLEVVGIDRDRDLVEAARKRGHQAILGDASEVENLLAGEIFDEVMMSHIIEHLSPTEAAYLLSSLADRSRPGSRLIIVTPNMSDWRVTSEWFWMDPTHVRPYRAAAVRELVNSREWAWQADGYEPMPLTKHTPINWLNRARFGKDYGRPGRWYRLTRV